MSAIANVFSAGSICKIEPAHYQMIQVASLNQQRIVNFIILGYHTGDLMFNGIHDKHRFLNRHLRTAAVTTPPQITHCIYKIISFFINLRQSIKVISNKEYPEIEGCSQTVPVWLLINMWNQWLLHDGLLFVGHHIYIYLAPDKFIRFLFQLSRIHGTQYILVYIGCLTASVQSGVAFVEADIQPIMKNPISFSLAIDESIWKVTG